MEAGNCVIELIQQSEASSWRNIAIPLIDLPGETSDGVENRLPGLTNTDLVRTILLKPAMNDKVSRCDSTAPRRRVP